MTEIQTVSDSGSSQASSTLPVMTAVAATKLNPPQPNLLLVRPALTQLLSHWKRQRLIVISAAAGYGKTTLASLWLQDAAQSDSTFHPAWLSLDEDDDDPARLVICLAAAVATIIPDAAAMARVLAAERQQPRQGMLHLLDALGKVPGSIGLVLDDVHRIQELATHQLLAAALEHSPANLHWMLISRHTAPVALGKLRLQGRVLELDSEDLRLQRTEVESFLSLFGDLQLNSADLDLLTERTQGWIAGIQLALLSMHRHTRGQAKTTHDLLEHARGDNVLLAEYLTGELLARQPEQMRSFLLKCAVAPKLQAGLCDAITGQADSAALLQQAVDNRLFLRPLDAFGEWYEMHHLFRELLLRYLRKQYAAAVVQELHLRAADWLWQHGDMLGALHCHFAAGAASRAADLVQQEGRRAILQYRLLEVHQWISLLPPEDVALRPQLLLDLALLDSMINNSAFSSSLTRAERAIAAVPDPLPAWKEDLALLKLFERFYGGNQTGVYHDALALALQTSAVNQFAAGWAYLIAALTGAAQSPGAPVLQHAELGREAFAAAGFAMGELYVLGFQASIYKGSGDAQQALGVCERARYLVEQRHNPHFTDDSFFTCLAGEILYWQDRPHEASAHFARALAEARKYNDALHILQANACLQLCDLASGRPVEVTHEMQQEEEKLWQEVAPTFALGARAENLQWQVLRWLALGKSEQAWQTFLRLGVTLETLHADAGDNPWLLLLTAYVRCGKDLDLLTPALERLQQRAQSANSLQISLQAQLLMASQQQQLGRHVAARGIVRRALHAVERTGYTRMLLNHPELAPSLRAVDTAYARQLLASTVQPQPESPVLALSAQELAVLSLMAEECSTEEIAEQLVVAPSTVKWHISRMYKKLGVKNRNQALAVAHRQRMLPAT